MEDEEYCLSCQTKPCMWWRRRATDKNFKDSEGNGRAKYKDENVDASTIDNTLPENSKDKDLEHNKNFKDSEGNGRAKYKDENVDASTTDNTLQENSKDKDLEHNKDCQDSKDKDKEHSKSDDKNDSTKNSPRKAQKDSQDADSEEDPKNKNNGKSTGEEAKPSDAGLKHGVSSVLDILKGNWKYNMRYKTIHGTEFGSHALHNMYTNESTGLIGYKVDGTSLAAGIEADKGSKSILCSLGTETLNGKMKINANKLELNGKCQNFGAGLSVEKENGDFCVKAGVNCSSSFESIGCSLGLGFSMRSGIFAEGSFKICGFSVLSVDTRKSFRPKFNFPPPNTLKIVAIDIAVTCVKWLFNMYFIK